MKVVEEELLDNRMDESGIFLICEGIWVDYVHVGLYMYGRIQLKDNIMQKLIRRKLGLFGHKQERKTTQGMARRHHQVGRDVASGTEPDGVGQRKLKEVDETGIGHQWRRPGAEFGGTP